MGATRPETSKIIELNLNLKEIDTCHRKEKKVMWNQSLKNPNFCMGAYIRFEPSA
jgi:hypothetical protein